MSSEDPDLGERVAAMQQKERSFSASTIKDSRCGECRTYLWTESENLECELICWTVEVSALWEMFLQRLKRTKFHVDSYQGNSFPR